MTLAVLFILIVGVNAYVSYFVVWAKNPNVYWAFNRKLCRDRKSDQRIAKKHAEIFVVVTAGGVLARGIPVPAETVMFVTDSFTTSTQLEHHITYLLPDQTSTIPAGTPASTIFYVN